MRVALGGCGAAAGDRARRRSSPEGTRRRLASARAGRGRSRSSPLDAEAVGEIAVDVRAAPPPRRRAGGRAARGERRRPPPRPRGRGPWARREAARRVDAVAGRTAIGPSQLHDDGDRARRGVVDLQFARSRPSAAAPDGGGRVSARSRGWRPSTSRTPTCSSGASAWWPSSWRGLQARRCSASSVRRAAASRPRSEPGCYPPSAAASFPAATDGGVAVPTGRAPARELERALDAAAERERALLVIDQFEETFTVCDDETERSRSSTRCSTTCRIPAVASPRYWR